MSTEDKLESEWKHVALSLPTALSRPVAPEAAGWVGVGECFKHTVPSSLWLTESYSLSLLLLLF